MLSLYKMVSSSFDILKQEYISHKKQVATISIILSYVCVQTFPDMLLWFFENVYCHVDVTSYVSMLCSVF